MKDKFKQVLTIYSTVDLNSESVVNLNSLKKALANLGLVEETKHSEVLSKDIKQDAILGLKDKFEKEITAYRHQIELGKNSFSDYQQQGENLYWLTILNLGSFWLSNQIENFLHQLTINSSRELSQINDKAFCEVTSHLNNQDFCDEVCRAYLKREPPDEEQPNAHVQALIDGRWDRPTLIKVVRQSPEFISISDLGCREYEIACYWQARKISNESLSESVSCFQAAIDLNPSSYHSYLWLSKALARYGRFSEEKVTYRKIVSIGIKLIEENRIEEALFCHKNFIDLAPPDKLSVYPDLTLCLIKIGRLEDVIDCYNSVLDLPDVIQIKLKLARILAESGLVIEAGFFLEKFTQIEKPNHGVIYETIWKDLHQLNSLSTEVNLYNELDIELSSAIEYFENSSQYKVIDINLLTKGDNVFIKNLGISIDAIILNLQDSYIMENIYNSWEGDSPGNALQCGEFINVRSIENKNLLGYSYHYNMLKNGYIYLICPFSGNIIKSNQSFPVVSVSNHYTSSITFFYRFASNGNIFYMIVLPYGHKSAFYFPAQQLLFIKNSDTLLELSRIISQFKAYMVSSYKQVKFYISQESCDKKKAVAFASTSNLGHYLWNDMTAIQYLYDNENFIKIEKILTGNYDFFKIDHVFPELYDKCIYVGADSFTLFKTVCSNNYFVCHPSGLYIEEKLINRIKKVSLENCDKEFLAEVTKANEKCFPLLAIQIRSWRTWKSQSQGISYIIKMLYAEFPKLGILFDGWSSFKGDNFLDDLMIEKEVAIMNEILTIIPNTIPTYSAIGATTYETVVWWSQAIDLHISPLGSGLTYASWIGNKPGVVHGLSTMLNNLGYQITTSLPRQNLIPQVLVPNEYIIDNKLNGNYECDWKIIYDEILTIINSLTPTNIGSMQ